MVWCDGVKISPLVNNVPNKVNFAVWNLYSGAEEEDEDEEDEEDEEEEEEEEEEEKEEKEEKYVV